MSQRVPAVMLASLYGVIYRGVVPAAHGRPRTVMAMQDSPSARLLGIELREWRLLRGKSADQAALTLRISPSKMSRTENGLVTLTEDELRRLLNLYQVPEGEQPRLYRLRCAGASERLAGPRLDQEIVTGLRAWAPAAVPSPLTTELYARAVTESVRRVRRLTPSEIKALARAGQGWQERLRAEAERDDGEDGEYGELTLTCVLDEAVLRRRRGPATAMAGQLQRLGQLAALPAVDIRVLPFGVEGPAFGPFTLYSYGNEDLTDALLRDGPSGTERVTDERIVTDYRYAFEELAATAADRDASAAMIKEAAGGWGG